jgi:hypothetical protein
MDVKWRQRRTRELRAVWRLNPDKALELFHERSTPAVTDSPDFGLDEVIQVILDYEEAERCGQP